MIEIAQAAATGLEAEAVPGWLWQAAIHQRFRAMSLLGENDGGYLVADLDARELSYRKGAGSMTPQEEFREAVARLNRAKDAAYRDAWKRRGEVISILANVARKVDRLEYSLDGAPATADESVFDTAADLLVYCLKYRAYLADQDAGTVARLFGGRGACPPYSDGPTGVEALLSRADRVAVTDPGQPAAGAASVMRVMAASACPSMQCT